MLKQAEILKQYMQLKQKNSYKYRVYKNTLEYLYY